jgi:hypothetical protein
LPEQQILASVAELVFVVVVLVAVARVVVVVVAGPRDVRKSLLVKLVLQD